MRETRSYGSVRGVRRNPYPYRDHSYSRCRRHRSSPALVAAREAPRLRWYKAAIALANHDEASAELREAKAYAAQAITGPWFSADMFIYPR